MKIAVSGANGFIGRALVAQLGEGPHEAVPLVRKAADLPRERIGDPLGAPEELLSDVEVLIHLAARVHVMHEEAEDALAQFRKVNTEGTLRLARAAAAAGCRRFVFVSSVKVHGESTSRRAPFRASEVLAPEDPYGISKQEAEAGLTALCSELAMELVIVRPPLVYGAGARGNFAALSRWIGKGIPLPLGLVTRNRRSLISVDNLVDFLIVAATHPNARGKIFLVSDGEDVSTTSLLQMLGTAAGRPARLLPVPAGLLAATLKALGRGADGDRLLGDLQVDISEARELGWRPPVSLADGLRLSVVDKVTH